MSRIKPSFLRGVKVANTSASHKCPRPLSRLCDITDWDDPRFNLLACDILDRGRSTEAPRHRKLWEFTVCVQALLANGLLTSEAVGLSVAAGYERVLYYLAQKVGRVVATDIYGEGSFSSREAISEAMESPEKFAPYPYPTDKLKMLYMNAFSLRFPSSLFDFCICMSSIEHFGGVNKALTAIKEMGRVVKRGGLVIITTECAFNGKSTHDVFSSKQIQQLVQQSGLSLVGDLSMEVTEKSLEHLLDMRRCDVNTLPHINLRAYGSDFTSICLVLRKEGEQPFGEQALNARLRYVDSYTTLSHMLPFDGDHHQKTIYERARRLSISVRMRLEELLSIETWLLKWERRH